MIGDTVKRLPAAGVMCQCARANISRYNPTPPTTQHQKVRTGSYSDSVLDFRTPDSTFLLVLTRSLIYVVNIKICARLSPIYQLGAFDYFYVRRKIFELHHVGF